MEKILKELKSYFEGITPEETYNGINTIRSFLYKEVTKSPAPIDFVRRIPIDKITPNSYNPNSVAGQELKLLYISIKEDGYTQPIVTIYDPEQDIYTIVDGYHRYFTMRNNKDIYELYNGKLPCVVIEKDINQRMASTVRHNRARGKHSVSGMSNMVFEMLQNGWKDEDICNKIGLEPEELLRLKHITGFSKLFEGTEYGKAWKATEQLKIEKEYKKSLESNDA